MSQSYWTLSPTWSSSVPTGKVTPSYGLITSHSSWRTSYYSMAVVERFYRFARSYATKYIELQAASIGKIKLQPGVRAPTITKVRAKRDQGGLGDRGHPQESPILLPTTRLARSASCRRILRPERSEIRGVIPRKARSCSLQLAWCALTVISCSGR
jgi:hypothetical protein